MELSLAPTANIVPSGENFIALIHLFASLISINIPKKAISEHISLKLNHISSTTRELA